MSEPEKPQFDLRGLTERLQGFWKRIDWEVVGKATGDFTAWVRNKLVTGLVVALPLVATIWVVITIFNFIDGRFAPVVRTFATANQEWIPGFLLQELSPARTEFNPLTREFETIPATYTILGAGFVLTIIVLVLLGVLFSNVVGKSVLNWLDGLMSRIPVISTLYNAIKQVIEAVQFIGRKDRMSFSKVALINYPAMRGKLIGFVTNTVTLADGNRAALIFLPTAPNPLTGFVVAVPYEELEISDMTVEEGTKLIVSMGLVAPPIFSSQAPLAPSGNSVDYEWASKKHAGENSNLDGGHSKQRLSDGETAARADQSAV